jgi:hypothetical protein
MLRKGILRKIISLGDARAHQPMSVLYDVSQDGRDS